MEDNKLGKMLALAMLALCKEAECKEATLRIIGENAHVASTDETITGGLMAVEVGGFARGVIAALKVLEGGDPFDEFDKYVASVEETARKTLEAQFQMQVERYSETSEA